MAVQVRKNKNTIIVFKGGLGNQMFQYAFYLSMKPLFDRLLIHYYISDKNSKISDFFYLDDIQYSGGPIKSILSSKTHNFIKSILFRIYFNKNVRLNRYVLDEYQILQSKSFFREGDIIEGYWQSLNLIEFEKIDFRDVFNLKKIRPEFSDIIVSLSSEIDFVKSLAVHIRRGDYLDNEVLGHICNYDYYSAAIDCFEGCKMIYFFTDDIIWVKENFNIEGAKYFSHEFGVVDLMLMSQFHNLVISNSSFSWWAAYLGQSNKKVVAPSKWFQNKKYKFNAYIEGWNLIDI